MKEINLDRSFDQLEELVSCAREYASENKYDDAIMSLEDLIESASDIITKLEMLEDK